MWAYLGVNAVGLLTHVWFSFLVMAQVVVAILFGRRFAVRVLGATFASALPFLVLWSPIFLDQLHNGATDWMPPFRTAFLADPFLVFYGLAIFVYGTIAAILFAGACTRVGVF